MANKLNMAIGKTHRLSSRVVGMQLTGGNFIGIGLSAVQMSAGFLIIGGPIIQGNAIVGIMIAIVGILLAVLIERLSLGGLSSVRVTKEHKRAVEDRYYQNQTPTDQETALFQRRVKDFDKDIQIGWTFGLLGMLLSACIGDVFWHTLFEPLSPWVGIPMSLACAAVIGLTFIHSELFKALMDGVLKEIVGDMSLMKTVVAVEEQNMQLDMMVDAYETVRRDAEVRAPAEEKIRTVIGRRLTGFAREVSMAADQVAGYNSVQIVDGSITQLALPAPVRGKYPQYRDELRRMLASNPSLSQREVARHFTVSSSTANDWLKKAKAGQ